MTKIVQSFLIFFFIFETSSDCGRTLQLIKLTAILNICPKSSKFDFGTQQPEL